MSTFSFIPNDPLSGLAARSIAAAPDRPAGSAQLRVKDPGAGASAADQALYEQCREAALEALAFWESCRGTVLREWDGADRLELKPFEAGDTEPDAAFDGTQIIFRDAGGVRPAMSVDVVTHELGHAILNAWVPALRNSSNLEHAAFHESFGDSLALLVALDDPDVAGAVLTAGLATPNAAETLLESLVRALAKTQGLGPESLQRHALNQKQWSAGGVFTSKMAPEYELSQVFTGSLYDAVALLYAGRGGTNAADLSAAGRTIGGLLATAIRTCLYDRNLFSAMGDSMLAATSSPIERQALKQGFGGHGLEITSTAIAQGEEAFIGPRSGTLHAVGRSLSHRVARRFGFVGRTPPDSHGRLRVRGRLVYWVGHAHDVDLAPVHKRLASVRASVYQETWLIREAGGWAIAQRPRDPQSLEESACTYAEHLYKRGCILNHEPRRGARAGRTTHAVRKSGRRARLVRLRFGCCS